MRIDLRTHTKGALSPLVLKQSIHVQAGIVRGYTWRTMYTCELDAFVDTGASRSCIPMIVCEGRSDADRLKPIDYTRPMDWKGEFCEVDMPIYQVMVTFCGLGPFVVRPIGTRPDQFLVGRDLLSRVFTALDGPANRAIVRDPGCMLDRIARRLLHAP